MLRKPEREVRGLHGEVVTGQASAGRLKSLCAVPGEAGEVPGSVGNGKTGWEAGGNPGGLVEAHTPTEMWPR